MIPNYLEDVKAAKVKYSDAWTHAHVEGDPRQHEWIKLFAADLHKKDAKAGLNGKRGNPNDLSMDAVNLLCDAADSSGRTPEGLPCVVVDCIAGAGGPNPQPVWNVFSHAPDASGAHVLPGNVPTPQPPMPTQPPGREEALDEMKWLDGYYASAEGLQRPNGLSLNGKPDFEGIAAWYLDVYQRERMAGKNRADSRAKYVSDIRHTDEWKQKHPGETP